MIFPFSILMQGFSILQYLWKNVEVYRFDWLRQYYAVVIISIILTTLTYLIETRKYHYIFFILRFILLLITYMPSGIYIGLKQLFIFAFFLDLCFFFPFPKNSIISALTFLSVYVLSIWSRVITQNIPLPLFHDIFYMSIFSLFAIFFFTILKYFYDSFSENENQIIRLNKTINKLTDANSGFQHYIRVIGEKSSEDERNRIIREIHDSIGYTLTTTMMLSTSVLESEKQTLTPGLTEVFKNITAHAKSGLNDMRIVLRILKVKNEKKEPDLVQLKKIVKAFENATNIKIRLDCGNAPNNFNEEVSHLVFRLVQEGMINSLRHGLATVVDIFLFVENNNLIITINDNGKGFKDLSPGLGIKGINERLIKLHGEFSITSSVIGVTMRIKIPLSESNDNEKN
jgi:signal transduction histidine kinase